MEPAWKLRCRIHLRPLRVLELCAGVSRSYAVVRDMGYRVATWHAVESDNKMGMVVDNMYDGAVKHVGDDVGKFNVTQAYDVVMIGPPCQPWSRANPEALGFDDERADVLIQCAGIIQDVLRMNPAAKYKMENVMMSDEIKQRGDGELQETYMAGTFDVINVKDYGTAQSMPRRVPQWCRSGKSTTRKRTYRLHSRG